MGGDLVGQALGRYRIVEKIGEGGMGVVFKATDEKLERTVALKVLSDGVVDDESRRLRFLREARIAASITHPNIATVHDVGETEDGHVYIAMELVPGSSLRHLLQQGPLPLSSALQIAKDLTRALIKAHELGIVHRDLKPDNVMVSESLEVKVLDFGLAKPLEPAIERGGAEPENGSVVTEEGHVLGTPGYMSPEQAAGRAVDERTDIFALGVVLYEMAAGARPFQGATAIEIIIATARDEPARLSAITTAVGPAFERAVFRCLEKNADARFGNARELMTALDSLGDLDLAPRLPAAAKHESYALPTQQSLVRTADVAPRKRGRPWVLVLGLGAAAVVAALGFRFASSGTTPSPVPSGGASAPGAPAPRATAIIDLPPPSSSNPTLLAEYAAGIQALHDDDWGIAQDHFGRVVELDPLLALGHLRLAMAAEGTLDESLRREHYAKAVGLRTQLSARDEGMMQALEPVLQRLREDRTEAAKRLLALSERYPADAEIHVWLAMLQETTLAGLASADRAIAIDPKDGQAWQSRGNILANLSRADDSRISYERCGATSPASAECFLGLIWLDSMQGQCTDAERDARRAVDRDPHLAGNLACVMYGAGRPIEAVREVIDQSAALFASAPRMHWQSIVDQTRVAIVTGDFVRARALAEQSQAVADANIHAPYRDHLLPALELVGIARETGDEAQAFRVAWSFVTRSETWSKSTLGDAGVDASLWLARQTVRSGGLAPSELDARRAAWLDDERRNIAQTGLVWTYAYAATAATPEEAKDALAKLPDYLPLSSFAYYAGIPDAEIGSVYLLAGRIDDALPYLTRAVANCGAFRHPFVHTRAALQLGQALESKGDTKSACGAYQKVVERWGNAKPRSISAEKAKARTKALGCAK